MAGDSEKGGNGGAQAHTGKLPHELMLEWVQTGLMEVPERVAKGYFVKKYVVLSPSERINLAKACAPYYAAKIVAQVVPKRDEQAAGEWRRDLDWVVQKLLSPIPDSVKDQRGGDLEVCQPQKEPRRPA